MVGTAFVVMCVDIATGFVMFVLWIPLSISIGCDTDRFVDFPPTVVAYIVVEAFATVGGADSFLGDLQKTYVVCPAIIQ